MNKIIVSIMLFISLIFPSCGKKSSSSIGFQISPPITWADPDHVDPSLPNVLIIGDSISIGYTLQVRTNLAGIANVYRAYDNCQDTRNGVAKLAYWLSGRHFDVIHFNFGMWDFSHKRYDLPQLNNPDKGPPADSDVGFVTNSPWQYQVNLTNIVTQLKATGAKLIFATTTPVPPNAGGRFVGSEVLYNQFAKDTMTSIGGVIIDDLYAQILPVDSSHHAPGDVHFDDVGYALLAGFVTTSIQNAL